MRAAVPVAPGSVTVLPGSRDMLNTVAPGHYGTGSVLVAPGHYGSGSVLVAPGHHGMARYLWPMDLDAPQHVSFSQTWD